MRPSHKIECMMERLPQIATEGVSYLHHAFTSQQLGQSEIGNFDVGVRVLGLEQQILRLYEHDGELGSEPVQLATGGGCLTFKSRWTIPSRWQYFSACRSFRTRTLASFSLYFSLSTMRSKSSPPLITSMTCDARSQERHREFPHGPAPCKTSWPCRKTRSER